MAAIPYDYLSLFLRHVAWEAEKRGVKVRAILKELAQGRIEATQSGLAIIGVAADGASTSYAIPAPSAGLVLSPESLAGMMGMIWDQVDEAVAADAEITDAELIAAVKLANKPIRLMRPSFALASPR